MASQWLYIRVTVWDGVMVALVGWIVKYIHLGAVIVQFHSEDTALTLFYTDSEVFRRKLIMGSWCFSYNEIYLGAQITSALLNDMCILTSASYLSFSNIYFITKQNLSTFQSIYSLSSWCPTQIPLTKPLYLTFRSCRVWLLNCLSRSSLANGTWITWRCM